MTELTIAVLQRDADAVSSAVDVLRYLFRESDNVHTAQTIIALMDVRDHIIQICDSMMEPVIDLGESNCESVDK